MMRMIYQEMNPPKVLKCIFLPYSRVEPTGEPEKVDKFRSKFSLFSDVL